jgi:hypothetical protein
VQTIEVSRGDHVVCTAAAGTCLDGPLPGHRTYEYTAVAVDEWGGRSEQAHLRVVVLNRPPKAALRRSGRTVIATASDADGDTLSFRWLLDGRRTGTKRRYVVVPAGRHAVTVEVRDGHGGIGRARLTLSA